MPPQLHPSILYQNPAQTLALLDIPTSISHAQHPTTLPSSPTSHPLPTLLSSPAPRHPYPSTEPKTPTARAAVLRRLGANDDGRESREREAELRAGLEEIRGFLGEGREWCLPRVVGMGRGRGKKKRKLGRGDDGEEPVLELSERASVLLERPLLLTGLGKDIFADSKQFTGRLIHNPHPHPAPIHLASSAAQTYTIPPGATFFHSSITPLTTPHFTTSIQTLPSTSPTTSGKFNFILLDPPWKNRSVRRSHNYETAGYGQEADPMTALNDMLAQHMAPHALVAIWITNTARVRASALESFQAWGVSLVEEWTWVKTTIHGAPVTELDGIWRKPYECLLLGRKIGEEGGEVPVVALRKRIIVGVPDLHSRKPSLKALVEPTMQDPREYRALEIFARNLTAGWCAWGDEVLRFNWEGHWAKPRNNDENAPLAESALSFAG